MKNSVTQLMAFIAVQFFIFSPAKGTPPQTDINTTITKDLASILFQGNSVSALSALYRDASALPSNNPSRDSLLALSAIGLIALGDDARFQKYPPAIRQSSAVKEVMNPCSRCHGSGKSGTYNCPTCSGTGLFPNRGKAQDALQSKGKALLSSFFRQSSFATDQKIAAKIAALPDPIASEATRAQHVRRANAHQQNDETIIYNGVTMTRDEFRRRLKYEEKFRRVHGYGPDDTPEQIQAAEEQRRARRAYQAARHEAEQAQRDAQEAYDEAQRAQEFAQEASSFATLANSGGLSSPSEFGYHADNLRSSADRNASSSLQSETDRMFDPYSGHTSSFQHEALNLSGNASWEASQAEERAREAQERSREASQRADDAWDSWQSY